MLIYLVCLQKFVTTIFIYNKKCLLKGMKERFLSLLACAC